MNTTKTTCGNCQLEFEVHIEDGEHRPGPIMLAYICPGCQHSNLPVAPCDHCGVSLTVTKGPGHTKINPHCPSCGHYNEESGLMYQGPDEEVTPTEVTRATITDVESLKPAHGPTMTQAESEKFIAERERLGHAMTHPHPGGVMNPTISDPPEGSILKGLEPDAINEGMPAPTTMEEVVRHVNKDGQPPKAGEAVFTVRETGPKVSDDVPLEEAQRELSPEAQAVVKQAVERDGMPAPTTMEEVRSQAVERVRRSVAKQDAMPSMKCPECTKPFQFAPSDDGIFEDFEDRYCHHCGWTFEPAFQVIKPIGQSHYIPSSTWLQNQTESKVEHTTEETAIGESMDRMAKTIVEAMDQQLGIGDDHDMATIEGCKGAVRNIIREELSAILPRHFVPMSKVQEIIQRAVQDTEMPNKAASMSAKAAVSIPKVIAAMDKDPSLEIQHGGDHYQDMVIEPAQFIILNGLGFAEGNVIKYVTRHLDKGGMEDLKKAQHYLSMIMSMVYGIGPQDSYAAFPVVTDPKTKTE